MRARWGLIAGAATAIIAVGAIDRATDNTVLVSVLYGTVIVASGLATNLLRRRRDRRDRTAAEGSIERELAEKAAAWSFQVALVAIAGLALLLLVTDQIRDGLIAFALLGAVTAAYWIRYAVIRARLT